MFEVIARSLAVLRDDRRGVTAVEYTIIAALVIGALVVGFTALSGGIGAELTALTAQV